jgi:phosphopantetheinyl transferase
LALFYQHNINESTKLGIWKIEEPEEFFLAEVPLNRAITHPHKRLQHLAGRYLLKYLFPDFPYTEIVIADTRKPYLPYEQYHFSISHCGNYAAAIVSNKQRVGIDIELPSPKIRKISHKFFEHRRKRKVQYYTYCIQYK